MVDRLVLLTERVGEILANLVSNQDVEHAKTLWSRLAGERGDNKGGAAGGVWLADALGEGQYQQI